MGAGSYSFIDVSVLEEVRGHFGSGEPLIILSPGLDSILWANGPGAQFLGYPDVESAMGAPAGLDAVSRRQIGAMPGYPRIGRERAILLRIGAGHASRPVSCRASQVQLPDGAPGILLRVPDAHDRKRTISENAARAIAGIGTDSNYAALVAENGEVLAETSGLDRLGIEPAIISRLIREVRHEPNRLIKRMIPSASGDVAAGIGRLSEMPPLHLLVLVAAIAEKHKATDMSGAGTEVEVPEPLAAVSTAEPDPAPEAAAPELPSGSTAEAAEAAPLRFSWGTDSQGRLNSFSDEFIQTFGKQAALVAGKTFREVASRFAIDGEGEIAELLERRDTWSGRTVFWPVEGTDQMVPVDLAALPSYDKNREFVGFRGFGVARLNEISPDPEARGLRLGDSADGKEPQSAVGDKVIPLEARRPGSRGTLSDSERTAFQEIAERLRRDAGIAPASEADEPDPRMAEKSFSPAGVEDGPSLAEDPGPDRSEPAGGGDDDGARRLLDQMPFAVVIRDPGGVDHANAEFLRLTGYATVDEFASSGGIDALFGEPWQPDGEEHPARHKISIRTSKGEENPCEVTLKSIAWQGRKALMLMIRPIEVSTAEQSLRERIEELSAILDTATDGVVLLRPDGAIRSVNHSAEALFGQNAADLAGKPFTSLFAIESQGTAAEYLNSLSGNGVASILNDGREVIGREVQGGFIPLFMTMGRLPGGFCAVLRDITQWKRAEEELIQARGMAERASSQKTGFLARISHEIRTPLNAIIGFSELMMDERFGAIGNERYRDYLRDINRSGNHVLELVNDLLDISKIEAGEQEMSFEAVSLNDALADAVAMMQPEANRERVIIRSSFASGLPDVVADRRSIKQIALNLLSNAIRFTNAGGQVILSTALEPTGEVVMRVRDTGIGMSRAEIDHALKPFKQVTRMQKQRAGGTGLGLPLTKAMVEANRAGFAIESEPDAGTIVEITFPAARVLAG